ncbi:hypothetical protein GWK90_07540 [Candidatus Hamiltonella defensa]|uniref:Uncharacterized protein n=1 Tax=Candidatus Williamhamiltonella defendens TaxID=138072 RepID=A0AAC9VIW6_9ENTR|nr:hypothetical protein [Candidatus Hamiltonella defensa]ASV33339.1 hypothetical protein CJJ18_03920 [Candidatus Hamiltonella defensa]AWK16298.1 hypothetical protein CCS40_03820 [Candidatus Hamiltonella defensa]MBK4362066.1 hypothetical protein [Candidatus Hamiltonella defensa]
MDRWQKNNARNKLGKKNNKGIPKKVTEPASQTKAEKETELDKTISGLNKTVEKIEKKPQEKSY